MGQVINITDAMRIRKTKNTTVGPEKAEVVEGIKKYIDILTIILKSGNDDIIELVKGAVNEVYQVFIEDEKRKLMRNTWEFRGKIREILKGIKQYENNIAERECRISSGISTWGTPYADSTLKQLKSQLKGDQEYFNKYKLELDQYLEDEVREAIDKEKEDEARKEEEWVREEIRNDARKYSRESLISRIKNHGKSNKRYAVRLLGGVKTLGRYRGQPLTEADIQWLKKCISYNEEIIRKCQESLKLKDKMEFKRL